MQKSFFQAGALFSHVRSHCKHLFIGSSAIANNANDDESSAKPQKKTSFRGVMDELVIWKKALSQHDIVQIAKPKSHYHENDLILLEKFDHFDQWDMLGRQLLRCGARGGVVGMTKDSADPK